MSTTTELTGIINAHSVIFKAPDGTDLPVHLYRGGDVSVPGIATLKALNVSKVISLQNAKQDSAATILFEHARVEEAGMTWVNVPMDSSGVFSYDDISKVPQVLSEIQNTIGPVLIHCSKGADRSSVVASIYRIQHGWSVDKAIKEGQSYGWAWWNSGMRKAVRQWAKDQGYK